MPNYEPQNWFLLNFKTAKQIFFCLMQSLAGYEIFLLETPFNFLSNRFKVVKMH